MSNRHLELNMFKTKLLLFALIPPKFNITFWHQLLCFSGSLLSLWEILDFCLLYSFPNLLGNSLTLLKNYILSWPLLTNSLLPSRTAAAAAKSLQSCLTLCDPIDGRPPGCPVPGILQARTLEWVAISFSNAGKWKVKMNSLSRVWLFATPWIIAYQASLSITNSWSLLMSIELVMPSNHLILWRPLLLLPSVFPIIKVFSNESALCIRWPKYWSFSFNISPSNEHPGLISFRIFCFRMLNLGVICYIAIDN